MKTSREELKTLQS